MNLSRAFSKPLPTFEDDIIRLEAKELIKELRNSPMRVILVPAPDPRHSGHMIRAVDSRPPDWYMELYRGRGRKTFKLHRFMRALQRIVDGKPVHPSSGRSYQAEIMKYLKLLINNDGDY